MEKLKLKAWQHANGGGLSPRPNWLENYWIYNSDTMFFVESHYNEQKANDVCLFLNKHERDNGRNTEYKVIHGRYAEITEFVNYDYWLAEQNAKGTK